MDIILFLAVVYLFTFFVGILLEKIRIPWIFASLIFGLLLAAYNPFPIVTNSETFKFLANLGMLFLLLMIGLEIDLKEMISKSKFFMKATTFIILFETLFGSLVIHFVFGYSWFISVLAAMSFATVGEAVLIPILDEFKLVNKPLGKTIIGIGVLDDVFEIATLTIACIMAGVVVKKAVDYSHIEITMFSLIILFILAFAIIKLRKEIRKLRAPSIEAIFLFVMFLFCLFVAVGEYADAAAIGAILAGVGIKNFLSEKRLETILSEVKTTAYGIFAPLFFVWVGSGVSINYLITYPLLVILVVIVSGAAKAISSYIVGRKELGFKESIIMGISLTVRFSSSIVVMKILYDSGLIKVGLYSVLIASTAVFIIVPIFISYLITRWKISPAKTRGLITS